MKSFVEFLVGLLSFMIWAFTFLFYWEWFVVPLGVVMISMAHAMGLAYLKKLWCQESWPVTAFDEEKPSLEDVFLEIAGTLAVLLMGFLLHLMMIH